LASTASPPPWWNTAAMCRWPAGTTLYVRDRKNIAAFNLSS